MKCPKCGHVFTDPAKTKAGKSRWKGMTKAQKSAEMKRVRAQALVKPKAKKT